MMKALTSRLAALERRARATVGRWWVWRPFRGGPTLTPEVRGEPLAPDALRFRVPDDIDMAEWRRTREARLRAVEALEDFQECNP